MLETVETKNIWTELEIFEFLKKKINKKVFISITGKIEMKIVGNFRYRKYNEWSQKDFAIDVTTLSGSFPIFFSVSDINHITIYGNNSFSIFINK